MRNEFKKHGTGNFLLKSALPRVLLLRAISEKPVIAYYAFPFTVSVLYCNFSSKICSLTKGL